MAKAFLVKYAEIGIKGKNRDIFEKQLVSSISHALRALHPSRVVRPQGRIFVEFTDSDPDNQDVIERLQRVFGISAISPITNIEDNGFEDLCENVIAHLRSTGITEKTFKVNARRANKAYPMDSMEINAKLGERILLEYLDLKVDVHKPQLSVNVEVRDRISIYTQEYPGLNGLPTGSAGRATLLLSGGIDSPVAGFMMAKRGCIIDAVYFHAPPYTSERAKMKVVDLAKILSRYCGKINLHVVDFTDIQLAIYDGASHEELTIIMRRYMMRIAEHIARENGSGALITGESLGQVASQTMQSLITTNAVCTLPVYRPLIGLDKQEITERAISLGSYETSILPYEDCCTIFVAKHPVTKPKLSIIERSEGKIADKLAPLVETAIKTIEVIEVDES